MVPTEYFLSPKYRLNEFLALAIEDIVSFQALNVFKFDKAALEPIPTICKVFAALISNDIV